MKDGCWATIRSKTARRCGSVRSALGQLAVHDPVGRLAARVLGVGPVEVVHQQPAAGAQQLLHEHDREAVDRPVLRAVEVDEVVERLDVARAVRARLHLLLEPPRVGGELAHDLAPAPRPRRARAPPRAAGRRRRRRSRPWSGGRRRCPRAPRPGRRRRRRARCPARAPRRGGSRGRGRRRVRPCSGDMKGTPATARATSSNPIRPRSLAGRERQAEAGASVRAGRDRVAGAERGDDRGVELARRRSAAARRSRRRGCARRRRRAPRSSRRRCRRRR